MEGDGGSRCKACTMPVIMKTFRSKLVQCFVNTVEGSRKSMLHSEKRRITKTCLYNFDPLKPHFYIVKLGFTGVNIIFLILLKSIDCGYSLEPPRRGGSNEYPHSMF